MRPPAEDPADRTFALHPKIHRWCWRIVPGPGGPGGGSPAPARGGAPWAGRTRRARGGRPGGRPGKC